MDRTMKMIRYIVCAMCIFICATPGFAHPYRGAEVWFDPRASNSNAYNPAEMYQGGIIRYYVTPSLRDVPVDLYGTTHHVNLEQMTRDAMQAWHERAPRLTFQQVHTLEEANYLVMPGTDNEAGSAEGYTLTTIAGAIALVPPYNQRAQLIYYLGNIAGAVILLRQQTMPAADYPDIQEVLEVALRATVEHEIGHTLGFYHPEPGTQNAHNATIFIFNPPSNRVHLMTGNLDELLTGLRADLGRAPRLADIGPTPEEIAALNIVIDNQPIPEEGHPTPTESVLWHCAASHRSKRSATSKSLLCTKSINVTGRASAPINNLLLLQ